METAIAKREANNLKNLDMASIQTLSEAFKESGLFPDIKSEAQAIVKIVAGQELQLPPVYSMQNFYIIQGRLSMAAEVMGLLLKRNGVYDYRVQEHTDEKCSIQFYQQGKEVYFSTFTIADAKRAGVVKPDSGWAKYPKAMLFARAISQGSRIVAPELMAGAYTKEEAESITPDAFEEVEPAPQPEPQEKPVRKGRKGGKESSAMKEALSEKVEGQEPPPGPVAKLAPVETQAGKPLPRDPASVKTLADLYGACFRDFGLQPSEVMKELGVKSNTEIAKLPSDCYSDIAAVYAGRKASNGKAS